MTMSTLFQIILLFGIAGELICQNYPAGTPQSPGASTQPLYQPNNQQSFSLPGSQSFPPNSQQQGFSQNQQSYPPNVQFQQQYPPQYSQNPQPFQNTQFQSPTGTMQGGTQSSASMQPPFTQPNSMQSFQQSSQFPMPQQSSFQTQQNPSFPEYPPTGQMPYPIQGQSAEFLSRPNANQLQTNQGQLPNPNTQFSNPSQTSGSAQFTTQGLPGNQFSNQGQPGNQLTTQGQSNPQFPGQTQSNTQFSTQGQPNSQFPGQVQSNNHFPTPGQQQSAQFPGQVQSSNQFPTPGQQSAQFPGQGQPANQFSTQGQPPDTQFPSAQQASLNNVTPQGVQSAAGTTQNPTGAQTTGPSSGTQSLPGTQPPQTSTSAAGSQLQTPTGAPAQQLPAVQPSSTAITPTGTQSGQPSLLDASGALFTSPEAQTAAIYFMQQLASILNDRTARDNFVFFMSDLRNMLTNPQTSTVLQQGYNGQFQDGRLNPPQSAYNNNVQALPQSNMGMAAPTITSPAGYQYYDNKHGHQNSNYQDLASITTGTTTSLADLIRYKGRILTNLLRDEVQVKSNAINKLTGDIPVVNTFARLGTGLADQFVGTVDKTLTPFLNSASGGGAGGAGGAGTTGPMNPQLPGMNVVNAATRAGSNLMGQTFGFLTGGGGEGGSQTPSNTAPSNSNTLATSNNNYQTPVAPVGTNYPGYNEFNRQSK